MLLKVFKKTTFSSGEFSIVPLRYEDRFDIMRWRNDQIYHLRQTKPLTEADQEDYFKNVVAKLFSQDYPDQLLFSFLEGDKCIGYGGLVHINWVDRNAEISFIIDTDLEAEYFHKHWVTYLNLIEQFAFGELRLHKIFTYAFDLRPQLYGAIESAGYNKEAILKEHCYFNGKYKDIVIHSKIDRYITIRGAVQEDKLIVFNWANDSDIRKNSFNSAPIEFAEHSAWFDAKLNSEYSSYFICQVNNSPAGLVRFDAKNNETTIGILIGKEYRNRGLAPDFIRMCCAEFRKKSTDLIYAYIKTSNIASIRSFEKSGFSIVEQLTVDDEKAVKYQLD